jgi:Arc/MetJ-type ribon-helix-helix transcriptional regulator
MAVSEKRSKIVSVRLSDAEFQELRALCVSTGARSASDLARDAIRAAIAENGGSAQPDPEKLHARVDELGHLVSGLQAQVAWLLSAVNTTSGK